MIVVKSKFGDVEMISIDKPLPKRISLIKAIRLRFPRKTKVYIVLGEIHYENTDILGVFRKEKKAENFVKEYQGSHPGYEGYDSYGICEFEVS